MFTWWWWCLLILHARLRADSIIINLDDSEISKFLNIVMDMFTFMIISSEAPHASACKLCDYQSPWWNFFQIFLYWDRYVYFSDDFFWYSLRVSVPALWLSISLIENVRIFRHSSHCFHIAHEGVCSPCSLSLAIKWLILLQFSPQCGWHQARAKRLLGGLPCHTVMNWVFIFLSLFRLELFLETGGFGGWHGGCQPWLWQWYCC